MTTDDMTTDDAGSARTQPFLVQGPLAVHRAGAAGAPGELLGHARVVTPTAALLDDEEPIDPNTVTEQPAPADVPDELGGPLLLVDAIGTSVPVLAAHASTGTTAIALEVDEPILHLDDSDDAQFARAGRSMWCKLFPRMRGC